MGGKKVTDEKVPLSALRWRCRRGMLELDRMLERFVELEYVSLDAEQSRQLMRLLEVEDDRLWDWLNGRIDPPAVESTSDSRMNALVEQIRQSSRP